MQEKVFQITITGKDNITILAYLLSYIAVELGRISFDEANGCQFKTGSLEIIMEEIY